MFRDSTPEAAGVPAAAVEAFTEALDRNGVNLHALLMLRGNDLFYERYRAPFDADRPHRMYSVCKSLVAVAIGFLAQEGKLSLDDRIVDFFPDKLPAEVPDLLRRQTIRDMLTMRTCFAHGDWFVPGLADRTAFYFALKPDKPAGTVFHYDSTGSYVLGALVERLSGDTLLGFLRRRLLDRLGGFENAEILRVPDGTAWGDSGLLCTPRAMLAFARFLMNGGVWEGERLLDEDYMRQATAKQTDTDVDGGRAFDRHGYGYQIWAGEQDSFFLYGMGGQFAICLPRLDLIVVCAADDQLIGGYTYPALFRAFYDLLAEGIEPWRGPRPAANGGGLAVARGAIASDFAERIDGVEFRCRENPMGITRFALRFEGDGGVLDYTNAQGRKRLPFGMGRNAFGKFPQLGYSDDRGNVHEDTGFMYDCAASAGWVEPRKLQLRVQIIDRYLGQLVVTFGFTEDLLAGVRMVKSAEDFLDEYDGWMIAEPADG